MNSRIRKKTTGKLGFGVKLRFGEGLARDEWFHLDLPHEQEEQAEDRLKRLQRMAKLLADAGDYRRLYLEEAAATPTERGFRAAEKMVEELSPVAEPQKAATTFRMVVNDLCSGKLHELYPDEIEFKSPASLDQTSARLAVYLPLLGDLTFDAITRDLIKKAKACIPKCAKTTRSKYIGELSRILRIAVDPLDIAEMTPTVKVPNASSTDLFTFIYPREEEQVAGSDPIAFEMRFLYAFLARNGGRITETLQYTWAMIDFDNGVINVPAEITKTKRARYWDIDPDVLEALRLRRLQIPDAEFVFVPPPDRAEPMNRRYVWGRFLDDMRAAGLTRAGIFQTTSGARRLRVHDYGRSSFVTLARALGMPDRWIMDRSGHESVSAFEQYDRAVRHVRERNLGWFAPMHLALKMVAAPAASLGQSRAKATKTPRNEAPLTVRARPSVYPPPPINPANLGGQTPPMAQEGPLGPWGLSISGQRNSLTAEHLTDLLGLAQKAKRWDLVTALGEALEDAERVREAASPKVTDIATARRRREEDR